MKLSQNTLNILKNFAAINTSILIRKGDTINTISYEDNVIAEARLEESFPFDFGIYDLPKFLTVLSLLDSPDLEFNSDHVVLRSGNRAVTYHYADPSLIKTFNQKVKMPPTNAAFNLALGDLKLLHKVANPLDLSDISIAGDGKHVKVTALNIKNSSLGSFVIDVEESVEREFEVVLNSENIKLIDGNYKVNVANGIVEFIHDSNLIKYWIAAESSKGLE